MGRNGIRCTRNVTSELASLNVEIAISDESRGVNPGVGTTELREVPCVLMVNSGRVGSSAIAIHSEGEKRVPGVSISRFITLIGGRMSAGRGWF